MTNQAFDYPAVPASSQVLVEAETLSEDILKDIELGQAKLSLVALKCLRLARLLNDFETQRIFELESGGYPRTPEGVSPDIFELGRKAGRAYYAETPGSETKRLLIYLESIEYLEQLLETGAVGIRAAEDPDIAISSANQYQHVNAPRGNAVERGAIRNGMANASQKMASRRTFIYHYATRKHDELRFSNVAADVFARVRGTVNASIGSAIPNGTKKFTAVYDNLLSQNPEDWANAAHGCRRVLQELADTLFPPSDETRTRFINGKEQKIKLGPNEYVNRLLAYVEDSSQSDRFEELVGSQLSYMSDRLHALVGAANKGSHDSVTREEADRCVVYTYMLVGDILSLRDLSWLTEQAPHENAPTVTDGMESYG
jgi:hypothetical protein